MPTKPSFDSLPLRKDGPHGNAWGLFGENDQLGMLNLLTPEATAIAAREIVDGTRVSTDLPVNRPLKPFWGRQLMHHTIKPWEPMMINDDIVTFNTQSSTQWDGFRHFAYQKEKLFFNGKKQEDFSTSTVNGTHEWVGNGGIVGRGVLLDYASWADVKGIEVKPFTATSISLQDLKEVASSQGTTFKDGDILIIRTGWTRAVNRLTEDEWTTMASLPDPPCIGLQQSEEMLRWLWDNNFAAAAGDQTGLETWPCQNPDYYFHEWLIAGWGMPIGELFDLERLSEECRKRKRWTFFFSSMPLKVVGGVATPPNGVAIF